MLHDIKVFLVGLIHDPMWSLFTGIVGCIFGHWLSIGRSRRESYRTASATFRKAFEEEIYWFFPEKNGLHVRNILDDCEYRHECAMNEFRFHVGRWRRKGFDRACAEYRQAIMEAQKIHKIEKSHIEKISKYMMAVVAYGNP